MTKFSRLLGAARIAAGRWRRDHVHLIVREPRSRVAFGVVGSPHVRHHFARVYLGEREAVVCTSHLHFRSSARMADSLAKRFGLAVVSEVASSPEFAASMLRVPRFVSLVIDLDESSDAYRARLAVSARDDLRRVRKNGLSWEISRDSSWSEEYFHRYHHPSVMGRHGEEGFIQPAAEIANIVRNHGGEFLRVMQGEQCIAALVAYPEDDRYHMGRVGWLDADPAWIKAGAFGAVYWFASLRARQLGFPRLSLGGSPTHLEDGLFRYKMKWDPCLEPGVSIGGDNHLLLVPEHPHARRLLEGRSMLVHGSDGKYFVLSTTSSSEAKLPPGVARAISHWFRWRREDESVPAEANSLLPEQLRPWFVEEPMGG